MSEATESRKLHRAQDRRFCLPNSVSAMTDEIIMAQIPAGSSVVDLGCGDGRLLEQLRDNHGCLVQGVELGETQLLESIGRGVPVLCSDLDEGLSHIPDDAFDWAVLSQTLQQVRHPHALLGEMIRIAHRLLVVVPNFGHWRVRLQVLRYGRAPVTEVLPYEWYNTPNLHFMSMPDFRDLSSHMQIRVVKELPIINGRAVDRAWAANLRADSVLYVLEREGSVSPSGSD